MGSQSRTRLSDVQVTISSLNLNNPKRASNFSRKQRGKRLFRGISGGMLCFPEASRKNPPCCRLFTHSPHTVTRAQRSPCVLSAVSLAGLSYCGMPADTAEAGVFLSFLGFLIPAIISSDSQPQGLGVPLGFAPPHCPSRRAPTLRPPHAPSPSHPLSRLRPGPCGLGLGSCRSLWSRPALHSSPWTTCFWGITIPKSTAWNLFKMLFHSPSLYSVKDKNKGLSFGVKNSPAYLQKGVIVYPLDGYLLSTSCMPDTGLREGLKKG